MFLETVTSLSSDFSLPEAQELDEQAKLATSIEQHFRLLAEMLGRAAALFGDTAEGERLRAAEAAAQAGQRRARHLLARFAGDPPLESRVRAQGAKVP